MTASFQVQFRDTRLRRTPHWEGGNRFSDTPGCQDPAVWWLDHSPPRPSLSRASKRPPIAGSDITLSYTAKPYDQIQIATAMHGAGALYLCGRVNEVGGQRVHLHRARRLCAGLLTSGESTRGLFCDRRSKKFMGDAMAQTPIYLGGRERPFIPLRHEP